MINALVDALAQILPVFVWAVLARLLINIVISAFTRGD